MRTSLNPFMYWEQVQFPYLLENSTGDNPINVRANPGMYYLAFVASGGAGGEDGKAGNWASGGKGGAGGTPVLHEYRVTLASTTTINLFLGDAGTITNGNGGKTQNTGCASGNAGGAAKPAYLKINGRVSTFLYAWGDENDIVLYSLDKSPCKNDILFTTGGTITNEWTVASASTSELVLLNTIGGESYTLARNDALDGNRSVENPVFWSLGGSGGGGGGGGGGYGGGGGGSPAGEGGPGGGYYRFYPKTLTIENVPGQNATAVKGTYSGVGNNGTAGNTDDFPDIQAGAGGGSGYGSSHYGYNNNYRASGGGASGTAGSNHTWNHGSAVRGAGGGGAAGGPDAGGGASAHNQNSPGAAPSGDTNATNHYSTAIMSVDYMGNASDAGRGGNNNEDGHTGWIYIYRFASITSIRNMGAITDNVTDIINNGSVTDIVTGIDAMGGI